MVGSTASAHVEGINTEAQITEATEDTIDGYPD